jgi:hypothetical protein
MIVYYKYSNISQLYEKIQEIKILTANKVYLGENICCSSDGTKLFSTIYDNSVNKKNRTKSKNFK